MKPEDKVPSFELCEKLWNLGVTKGFETERVWANAEYRKTGFEEMMLFQTSMYSLFSGLPKEDVVRSQISSSYQIIPAPDLSEMGELLPDRLPCTDGGDPIFLMYNRQRTKKKKHRLHYWLNNPEVTADTEPNARAEMLIALRENE